MNDCTEYIEKISAYIDGELSDDERRIIEKHICECPHCAALLEFYGEISQAVDETCRPVPDGFTHGVMLRVRGGGAEEKTALRLETEDDSRIKPPVRNKLTLKAALTRYIPAAACLAVILLAAPRLSGLGCKSSMDFSELSLSGGGGAPPAVMEDAFESGAGEAEYSYSTQSGETDLNNDSGFAPELSQMPEAPQGAPEEAYESEREISDEQLAAMYGTENVYAVIVVRGALPELEEIYDKKDTDGGVVLLYITRKSAQALIESGYYSEVLDENSQQAIVVYVS